MWVAILNTILFTLLFIRHVCVLYTRRYEEIQIEYISMSGQRISKHTDCSQAATAVFFFSNREA